MPPEKLEYRFYLKKHDVQIALYAFDFENFAAGQGNTNDQEFP